MVSLFVQWCIGGVSQGPYGDLSNSHLRLRPLLSDLLFLRIGFLILPFLYSPSHLSSCFGMDSAVAAAIGV